MLVQGMMANRYMATFRDTILGWNKKLMAVADVVQACRGAGGGQGEKPRGVVGASDGFEDATYAAGRAQLDAFCTRAGWILHTTLPLPPQSFAPTHASCCLPSSKTPTFGCDPDNLVLPPSHP